MTAQAKAHVEKHDAPLQPKAEHSIPWFWPFAAAIELGEEGLEIFGENLEFVGEAGEISAPPRSTWATKNEVALDLDTMRLRDFSKAGASGVPVFIDPPYAAARLSPIMPRIKAWSRPFSAPASTAFSLPTGSLPPTP